MATSNPQARLSSLFQGGSGNAQGNDALRYVAPKEPSRQQQQAQAQAQIQNGSGNGTESYSTPSIVYSTTVALYQYETSTRKYVQMKDPASGNTSIGCVIVGSDAAYNLLFYNVQKQHLCLVPIKFGFLKMTLQPKNYINFYDEKGTNWSIKFTSEALVAEFRKQIFLTKIHVEIWGSEKSVTKSNPNGLIHDELVYVKEDVAKLGAGDTVAVSFSCWRVVGNASCAPNEVVSKYAPFERASESDLRKMRLGDGAERIKALEEGVMGMRKGGRRMILAPPGKTNGQDWYLLEVQVHKTKSGSGGSSSSHSRSKSMAPTSTSATEDTPEKGSSQRRSSGSRRRNTTKEAASNDLVPFDEEAASKDEMELRELKLLQREKQLEIQAKALERAQMGGVDGQQSTQQQQPSMQPPMNQNNMYNANQYMSGNTMGGGSYGAPTPMYNNAPVPMMSSSGRPLDSLMMELHAKVDYLIRMAPTSNSLGNTSSAIGGPADVSSVIRGVERLASENERLLLQINSQNQQYTSYEKRCEELYKQNQRLQEEKRAADDKYQSIANQQLNYASELASLTSARDAAITQTNRLHVEYQQLLNAFYQKQQVSSDAEEKKQELTFEREARVRLEKELQKEARAKSFVDQELQLVKKELEVVKKMRESESQRFRADLEQQHMQFRAKEQELDGKLAQARMEAQQQEAQRLEEWQSQTAQREKALQQQVDSVQAQLEQALKDRSSMLDELNAAQEQQRALEQQLAERSEKDEDAQAATHENDEERARYQQQIEFLTQRVKELEEEKFERVQEDLNTGRLSSPAPSPRRASQSSGFFTGEATNDALSTRCAHCEEVSAQAEAQLSEASAKAAAADRALAMVEAIKKEAEQLVASSSASSPAGADRERLIVLFKESVNEMYFRFQDYFEEEPPLEGKQVLAVIRKVLKQNTKQILARLEEQGKEGEAQQGKHDEEQERGHAAAPATHEATTLTQPTAETDSIEQDDEPPPPAAEHVEAQEMAEAKRVDAEPSVKESTVLSAVPNNESESVEKTKDAMEEKEADLEKETAMDPSEETPKEEEAKKATKRPSGGFSKLPTVMTAAQLMHEQGADTDASEVRDSDASDFEA